MIKGRRNGLDMGGGGVQKFLCAVFFFCITLSYQKDKILYISISVISNIH